MSTNNKHKPKIILCGHNRIRYSILANLRKVKKKVLVIDYNPEVISAMVKEGYHCLYGDVTDEEIIERMNLKTINRAKNNNGFDMSPKELISDLMSMLWASS